MKPLVLHHLPIVSQQIHAQLQILSTGDVFRHDIIVCSVQENFSEQLDRLSLCDVGLRAEEDAVVSLEEKIEIDCQILGNKRLVLREYILDRNSAIG